MAASTKSLHGAKTSARGVFCVTGIPDKKDAVHAVHAVSLYAVGPLMVLTSALSQRMFCGATSKK
jgi:hypothetical protein